MIPRNADVSYLELILGPMYSGKTSRIINLYEYCLRHQISVCVINHALDKRYSENMLSTHDGKMIPCVNLHNLSDIYNNPINAGLINYSKIVLINEGQFFKDLLEFTNNLLDTTNPNQFKQIYICGLDGDFKRNKFGQLLDLIPYCDNVTKLHSICKRCQNNQGLNNDGLNNDGLNNDGLNAIFSHRVTGEKDQTLIGSSAYIPLCRSCYLQENRADFMTISHTISLPY